MELSPVGKIKRQMGVLFHTFPVTRNKKEDSKHYVLNPLFYKPYLDHLKITRELIDHCEAVQTNRKMSLLFFEKQ